ncbi:MAG TPA: hypothetical protein VNE41_07170 [Chitinophagaceae bacterium]|nr:hypothetical protein [Chitinophagaceae bacterium]
MRDKKKVLSRGSWHFRWEDYQDSSGLISPDNGSPFPLPRSRFLSWSSFLLALNKSRISGSFPVWIAQPASIMGSKWG